MKVVNLNSPFDWVAACEKIIEQATKRLCSADLGVEPTVWQEVSAKRMPELKWLFLIDKISLEAQIEKCPHGEGEKDNNTDNEEPPFPRRQGGKNRERSSINRRPIQLTGGGIVEPLGLYTPLARTFARSAPLLPEWKSRYTPDKGTPGGKKTLDGLLPPEVKDEPAIFICPELLFNLPCELADALQTGEPHPDPSRNWTELFLRMTILHEIGHHLLPVPASTSVIVSEALANAFCASLLAKDERPWLFAKAWLLQPSMYLGWFVPLIWGKAGLKKLPASWDRIIRESLGRKTSATSTKASDDIAMKLWLKRPGIPMSPQLRQIFHAMAKELGTDHRCDYLDIISPRKMVCEFGPFEEHAMPWNDSGALIKLLYDNRLTISGCAFRLLDSMKRLSDEEEKAIDDACDRFLADGNEITAKLAWESDRARRLDGVDNRFIGILLSPLTQIAQEILLMGHFRLLFSRNAQRAVLRKIVGSAPSTTVRAAAAMTLADLLIEENNNSKAAWAWLIQEENYLVYAAGANRAFKGISVTPFEVAFSVTRSIDETVEQESTTQKLNYQAKHALRAHLESQRQELLYTCAKFLLRSSKILVGNLYEVVKRLISLPDKPCTEWPQAIIKTISGHERSILILCACRRRDWALTDILLDYRADLSDYTLRKDTEGQYMDFRNAFHVALAAPDVPTEIVTRMAELPEALETKNGDGQLPIEIAIKNAHPGAIAGLMQLPESTTRRLFEVVVTNNCFTALQTLLQKKKLSDDTRQKLLLLAKENKSTECANLLGPISD